MWWMAAGALVGGYASLRGSKAQNRMAEKTYQSTMASLEAEAMMNNLKAEQAVASIVHDAYTKKEDFRLEVDKVLAKEVVRRGEGVTAGASAGRAIQGTLQLASRASAQQDYQTRSAIESTYTSYIDSVNANSVKRTQAYNKLQGSIISNTDAWLQVATSAVTGAVAFGQFGDMMSTSKPGGPGAQQDIGGKY